MESRKKTWLGAAALAVVALWIYWPALQGTWLWDDEFEITRNPALTEAGGWWRIWLRPEGADYYPLKTAVQWCEWHLWGDWVVGYHIVSLGLHVLGSFLLWRLLARLGLRGAFWAGMIFAAHPLAVESVAWISELKNVLSLPLLLLAMGAWLDFGAEPVAAPVRAWRGYVRALLWFLLAMLCKSSVVMFPAVLLLYAWWRTGRVSGRDLKATLPFFALALILGVVTVWFQSRRAIAGMELHLGGPLWRLGSAGMAVAFYFFKCVLPIGLMPIYPDWGPHPQWLQPTVCWLLIAAALFLFWRRRDQFGRGLLFGAGFFVLNLVPVLGFIPMSYLRISRVADHLCYLPLLGIVGLAVAEWPPTRWPPTSGRRTISLALLCLVLAFLSHRQAAIYRDGGTFWGYAVRQNAGAWLAQNNLGNVLNAQGRQLEAENHFRAALQAKPDYAEPENNWGSSLLQLGRIPEAIGHFQRAIQLKPDYAEAYCDLGDAYVQISRYREAIGCFEQAMRLKANYAEPYSNRGLVYSTLGRQPEAIADFERALQIEPRMAEAELDLGLAYSRSGDFAQAIRHYRRALQIRPDFREAHNNLGSALFRSGRTREAIAEYEEALRLDPNYAEARRNLEIVRAQGKPRP